VQLRGEWLAIRERHMVPRHSGVRAALAHRSVPRIRRSVCLASIKISRKCTIINPQTCNFYLLCQRNALNLFGPSPWAAWRQSHPHPTQPQLRKPSIQARKQSLKNPQRSKSVLRQPSHRSQLSSNLQRYGTPFTNVLFRSPPKSAPASGGEKKTAVKKKQPVPEKSI
jgi:hypothetical protein